MKVAVAELVSVIIGAVGVMVVPRLIRWVRAVWMVGTYRRRPADDGCPHRRIAGYDHHSECLDCGRIFYEPGHDIRGNL